MNFTKKISENTNESGLRPYKFFVISTFFIGIGIIILFLNFSYIENLGFKYGDDGVVLSQSFRLINGAIAHKDFISIKPVLSAVLHAIHFYSPFPLQVSSRWVVIFEYFLYSFIWTYLLLKIFNLRIWKRNRYLVYSMSIGLFTFFLNISNQFYFPTPAVDATLFSMLSLAFFIRKFQEEYLIKKTLLMMASIFFITSAALCQQSFVFPALALCVYIVYKGLKNQKKVAYFSSILLGLIPFWIYLIWVIKNNAFIDFKHQVINRHEIFQAGIIMFLKSFIHAKMIVLNILILLVLVFIYIKNKRWLFQNNKPITLTLVQKKQVAAIIIIYSLFAIFSSFVYLKGFSTLNKTISYELFWIFAILSCLAYFIIRLRLVHKITIVFTLIVAWSGSATMHINAPFLTVGILASGILIMSSFTILNLFSVRYLSSKFFNIILPYTLFLLLILFGVLFFIKDDVSHKSVNTDNIMSSEINMISDEFGDIKMDSKTTNYFQEVSEIFKSYPGIKNNFIVLPDNPLVYLVFNSKNPFPADDLLPYEYTRFQTVIVSKMEKIINSSNVYLIVDKYHSSEIMNNMNSNAYNVLKYFREIQYRFVEIPIKSNRLLLYKSM